MTTPQHKIGSGFGAHSTADEVLGGSDLSGKFAVITGRYSGIGIETTRALGRAGAEVLVPARRPDVAREALGDLDGVELQTLDLGDQDSVRTAAERILAADRAIDILINCAAIMASPETRLGPGWEAQFAVNPGGILTPLQRHLPKEEMVALGWIDEDGAPTDDRFKTPQQGAATHTWCATSPQLDGMGGLYCEDCDVAELVAEDDPSPGGVREYAIDPGQAARLWAVSAELTGVDALTTTAR